MQRKVPSAIANITLNRATFTDVLIDGLTFVNFFYGNNGAGKSSIAHAIAEDDGVVWADGKTVDDFDVLVYNQDFINDNFVNYGDLKGVFIFGEEDIEAKKKIAELTNQKKQKMDARQTALDEYKKKSDGLASALTQFQDTCFSKTASIRRRFEKCMDGKKQKKNFAEAVLGEVKPIDHDLAELERLYDVAFDDSARAYPEFKKAAATTYGSLPGKDLLDRMIVSSSDTPFAKFMKALGDTASDWVRDGHTHYAGAAGGKCPYCQQRLPANFEADIAATFDAQYQQDIRDLGQFQTIYERETREIVRAIQANASDVMPTIDLMAYQEKLALLESNFEINRQRIAEKVKEPSKTISLEDTDTLLLEIGAMIDEINKQIKANNDVVSAKRSSKTKCKTEIMQYLAFMLAADVKSYQDEVARLQKEIEDVTERGKKLKKEIGDLTTEISALNKHNANTEAAIDSINKILRDSGFQGFGIRAKTGVENVYEVIREDGSVAENLSEGERNFIAFLYFYHQVRGSMSSEEIKEKIVVIDDPVSSMDSTALFLVSAIVREMVNVCRNNTEYLNPKVPGDYIKQLFVLTHNVYFHREVTYQQVGYYNCTSFYMIRKNDNISTIKLCKRQSKEIPSEEENYNPVQNSYAALWDELRDLQSTIPALNVMRRILEYYFLQLCGYEGSDLREIVLDEHRNMLISLCQLILEGMLLTTDSGEYKLASFVDEQRMNRLYEKFILEYYAKECPQVTTTASQIPWALDDGIGTMLPVMQSDIMLTKDDTVLIIDAKYYTHTTQTQYDVHTLHSGNLYQIFTYVKNKDTGFGDKPHTVSGMLLYAATDEAIQPDNSYQMSGNKISVRTLDLNQEFSEIATQLNTIVDEHFSAS